MQEQNSNIYIIYSSQTLSMIYNLRYQTFINVLIHLIHCHPDSHKIQTFQKFLYFQIKDFTSRKEEKNSWYYWAVCYQFSWTMSVAGSQRDLISVSSLQGWTCCPPMSIFAVSEREWAAGPNKQQQQQRQQQDVHCDQQPGEAATGRPARVSARSVWVY